jgi:hypothetical protein
MFLEKVSHFYTTKVSHLCCAYSLLHEDRRKYHLAKTSRGCSQFTQKVQAFFENCRNVAVGWNACLADRIPIKIELMNQSFWNLATKVSSCCKMLHIILYNSWYFRVIFMDQKFKMSAVNTKIGMTFEVSNIQLFLLMGKLLVSCREKWKFLITDFHVLGLFIPEKYNALVRRLKFCHFLVIGNALNLFYIEIRLRKHRVQHFLVGICMEGTLRMSNFKTLSAYFCS